MHIPQKTLNANFCDKKARDEHFTGRTDCNISFCFRVFERKSPFFVLKIFTRPSVVLCLLLQPLRALRAGLSALSVII